LYCCRQVVGFYPQWSEHPAAAKENQEYKEAEGKKSKKQSNNLQCSKTTLPCMHEIRLFEDLTRKEVLFIIEKEKLYGGR